MLLLYYYFLFKILDPVSTKANPKINLRVNGSFKNIIENIVPNIGTNSLYIESSLAWLYFSTKVHKQNAVADIKAP